MFDLQGLNFRYFVKKHEYTQATRYYWKLGESFTEMKTKIPKILELDGKNIINILKIGDLKEYRVSKKVADIIVGPSIITKIGCHGAKFCNRHPA